MLVEFSSISPCTTRSQGMHISFHAPPFYLHEYILCVLMHVCMWCVCACVCMWCVCACACVVCWYVYDVFCAFPLVFLSVQQQHEAQGGRADLTAMAVAAQLAGELWSMFAWAKQPLLFLANVTWPVPLCLALCPRDKFSLVETIECICWEILWVIYCSFSLSVSVCLSLTLSFSVSISLPLYLSLCLFLSLSLCYYLSSLPPFLLYPLSSSLCNLFLSHQWILISFLSRSLFALPITFHCTMQEVGLYTLHTFAVPVVIPTFPAALTVLPCSHAATLFVNSHCLLPL